MNNANGKAFITNNCLLSDTLALPSADVNIKGSPWANTRQMRVGHGQEAWKRHLAMTRVPSDSDEGCFVTAESGRASAGETAMGGKSIEFQFIEARPDLLLYVWRKNWQWKQLRERWQEWSRAWKNCNTKRSRKKTRIIYFSKETKPSLLCPIKEAWFGEGSAALSASLDSTYGSQRRKIKQPLSPKQNSKTNCGEYLFHTTRRKDVELTAVSGSEARKPLACSKALNMLTPKVRKTKGNS